MVFTRKLQIKGRTYLVEVEGYRDESGKVRQRFVRYLGRMKDGKLIEPKHKRLEITRVFSAGVQTAVQKLMEEHGLDIDPRHACLATMHLLKPSSLNQVVKNFHRFGLDTYFGDLTASRLYDSLDLTEEETYRLELQLYRSLKRLSSAIFYDITTIYFYGASCALARRGYNPKAVLPQIGIGLAIDEEGLPIFHKVFRGNVHHGATLPLFIECLKNAGIRRCTLVLDRGFFSKENVALVKEGGYSLIVGVPLRGRLKSLMKHEKPSMRETVLLGSTYLCVKEIRWAGGKLVLCYNEMEAANVKNLVLRRGGRVDVDLLGCHALFSSNPYLSKEEIVKRYFEKDAIEKTFRALKSVLGLSPVRHWLENKVNGHLFVCCLAYLFFVLLQRKLVKEEIPGLQALDELKYVYKVVTMDGVEKLVATTKTQKKVLKRLGVKLL